jgi:hypothetical protein
MLCEIVLPDVLFLLYPVLSNEQRKKECISPHSSSYVCVLTEVCLLVLWVMVVHGSNFCLLAKAVCNNNQLSFALKHWCIYDYFACIMLAVYH